MRLLEIEPPYAPAGVLDEHWDVGAHHRWRGLLDRESKEPLSAGCPLHGEVVRWRTDVGFVVGVRIDDTEWSRVLVEQVPVALVLFRVRDQWLWRLVGVVVPQGEGHEEDYAYDSSR